MTITEATIPPPTSSLQSLPYSCPFNKISEWIILKQYVSSELIQCSPATPVNLSDSEAAHGSAAPTAQLHPSLLPYLCVSVSQALASEVDYKQDPPVLSDPLSQR